MEQFGKINHLNILSINLIQFRSFHSDWTRLSNRLNFDKELFELLVCHIAVFTCLSKNYYINCILFMKQFDVIDSEYFEDQTVSYIQNTPKDWASG